MGTLRQMDTPGNSSVPGPCSRDAELRSGYDLSDDVVLGNLIPRDDDRERYDRSTLPPPEKEPDRLYLVEGARLLFEAQWRELAVSSGIRGERCGERGG